MKNVLIIIVSFICFNIQVIAINIPSDKGRIETTFENNINEISQEEKTQDSVWTTKSTIINDTIVQIDSTLTVITTTESDKALMRAVEKSNDILIYSAIISGVVLVYYLVQLNKVDDPIY